MVDRLSRANVYEKFNQQINKYINLNDHKEEINRINQMA